MSVPRQKRGKETGWGVNTTGKSAPFANAIKKHTPISQFMPLIAVLTFPLCSADNIHTDSLASTSRVSFVKPITSPSSL